jgi:putative ABC transport system permease protein
VTTGGIRVRTLLLVGQLACSVFFIASALIVGSQLSLMDSADPGFDRDRVLTTRYVFNDSVMASKREVIKTAFTKLPGVESATTLWPGPGAETTIWTGYREADPQTQFDFQILGVDPDFLQTYGVKLIAGRNVGPDFVKYSDAEFVINETTVKMLGWNTEEGPLGKALRVGDMRGHVIGIVKDFHYASLRKAIPPLVLVNWSRIALAVRIRPDHVDETMADIERTWKQFFDQPNELKPVDSFWGWCNYRERRLRRGYTYLSWSALFLAGLGVFGLAAYEAEQRRREVGVRKVLGASIGSIVSLFWRSHVKLVVLAIIIAWPLPFFLMRDWLANFAYRIDLTALPFVVSGGATTVLFLAVVGSQAMRIGRVDPAETLRRE